MSKPVLDFARVFASLPIPATLIDAEGIITDINPAFVDMARTQGFEIDPQTRIGQPIREFALRPRARQQIDAIIEGVLSEGRVVWFREEMADAMGKPLYIDIRAEAVRDESGRIAGAVILRQPVTEQVAQEQRQEQRQRVIDRVRQAIWKMESREDVSGVLVSMREGLRELGVPFANCGVNLVDARAELPHVLFHSMSWDGEWHEAGTNRGAETLLQIWRSREIAYRRDLEAEDALDEQTHVEQVFARPIRCILDVPFSRGTLAVNSTEANAFSAEDIEILQDMAQILEEGFKRFDDFAELERRNRQLEEKEHLLQAFHQIGRAILEAEDLEVILDRLTEQVLRTGILRSLSVSLVDAERGEVRVVRNLSRRGMDVSVVDVDTEVREWEFIRGPEGTTYSLDSVDIMAEVVRSGRLEIVEGWDEKRFNRQVSDPADHLNKVSYFIPVKNEERVLAVLATGSTLKDREEVARRIEAMKPLIDQVAVALEHVHLLGELQGEIDERRRQEAALRESEVRYRELFGSLPDPVVVFDQESHRILDCNPSMLEGYGYRIEELRQMTPRDLHPPEERETVDRRIDDRTDFSPHSYTHLTREGRSLQVEMHTQETEYMGRPAWISILRDVSERQRAEREREQLIGELEGKNAELERFTYTVSHDLKSPLITIRGFLGLLARDLKEGGEERMREDMRQIDSAASQMQRLLDELLELSRIGRIANPSEWVDMGALAREAAELVSGRIAAKKVDVAIEDGLPCVRGDRLRLLEVWQNLIDNAVKFMGDQEAPRVEIGVLRGEKGEDCFFVRDNGIGIDERYHEQVFGLFDRLDSSGEGTGIGLALVRRIVEVHGGRIWVESAGKGKGCSFYFTLPAEAQAGGEPA